MFVGKAPLSFFSQECRLIASFSKQSFRSLSHFSEKQQQQQSPTLQYKPLPRSGDDFVLDFRKDRRVLLDGYKPKNADCRIRFEVLDEKDIELMTQYITQHFVEQSNIVKCLGVKGENLIELLQPTVTKWLNSGTSQIFKEDDKIAGIFCGNYHPREEFEEIYRGQLFHDNPKFVIKDDYAEDIKNGPFKDPDTNRIAVLLSELEWQTGKFLPKDCQSVGIGELCATHPKYMKLHLATKAGMFCRQLLQEKGATHEAGYCVAMGTYKLSKLIGHKTIYSLPYDKFLENGKPVFYNLHDGATIAHVTLYDYSKDQPKLDGKI